MSRLSTSKGQPVAVPPIRIASGPKHGAELELPYCTIVQLDGETIDAALFKHTSPRPHCMATLAAAIAEDCSADTVRHYLNSYPAFQIKAALAEPIQQSLWTILFWAAERNDAAIMRVLLEAGASAEVLGPRKITVLGFCVMRSKWTVQNPLEVIKTLLAHGAKPTGIPKDMWQTYINQPCAEQDPSRSSTFAAASAYPSRYRSILAEMLHLSLRYFLWKASQIRVAEPRGLQLATAHNYLELLKVPYMVIGQQYACRMVVEQVSAHIGMNVKSPLVLTFAGLSGHGKTELATKMGHLLNVAITNIDCAQMESDRDIFGSHSGWSGYETGSQLNNHLASNSGKRSVVFLDEFDKTDQSVRNSLLLILDSGEYHDRRVNKPVDSSKTIWILATNLGDTQITKFYDDNMLVLTDQQKLGIIFKTLTSSLKDIFSQEFGAPMAGRMRNIAPFYPFDILEQAVIVHKFCLEVKDEGRKDIDTSPAHKHFCRHLDLVIQNDGPLCTYLAKEAYISELGARSLKSCADEIRKDLYIKFVDNDLLIDDSMNDAPLSRYTVSLQPIPGTGRSEVVVSDDGLTEFYARDHRGSEPMLVDQDVNMMAGMMRNMRTPDNGDDEEDF